MKCIMKRSSYKRIPTQSKILTRVEGEKKKILGKGSLQTKSREKQLDGVVETLSDNRSGEWISH